MGINPKQTSQRIIPKVSRAAHDLLVSRFGKAATGAGYIVDAFPAVLHSTLASAEDQLGRPGFLALTEAVAGRIVSDGNPVELAGVLPLACAKGTVLARLKKMHWLEWVAIEIASFALIEKRERGLFPQLPDTDEVAINLPRTDHVEGFYAHHFPTGLYGVSLILNLMPGLVEKTITELAAYGLLYQALTNIQGFSPGVAGELVVPALANELALMPSPTKDDFAIQQKLRDGNRLLRFLVEVGASGGRGHESQKMVSCRVEHNVPAELTEWFPTPGAGLVWAAEAAPSLLATTILEELAGSLAETVVDVIFNALRGCETPAGWAVGRLLIPAVESWLDEKGYEKRFKKEILSQITPLPLFSRACIELLATQERDFYELDGRLLLKRKVAP